jgi:amidase
LIGNVAASIEKLVGIYGHHQVKRNVEWLNYAMYRVGQVLKAHDFVEAKRSWRQFGTIMDQMLNRFDMILTPTLGEPPVLINSQQPSKSDKFSIKLLSSWAGKIILSNRKFAKSILEEITHNMMRGQMPFSIIANITGLPAMSVPLHWTESGLPCGVQFIGGLCEEAKLLRLAAQLENAQPWIGRKPPILY